MAGERELSPYEKFHTYMRAWKCGVGALDVDERLATHPRQEFRALWRDGYDDGLNARVKAQTKACKRFKYEPNILRTEEKS